MTRFDDIQARHAKATPGPWTVDEYQIVSTGVPEDDDDRWICEVYDETKRQNDVFIAACPDDVRWLLNRVTRLETALTRIRDYPFPAARTIARAALDTEKT